MREYHHGYSFQDVPDYRQKIRDLKPGKSSEVQILQTFGSPSNVSTDGERTFTYAEIAGSVLPVVNERQSEMRVLWIAFDQQHVLKACAFREYDGSHDFRYHSGVTEVESVRAEGVINQIFKSFGKVSFIKDSESKSATGK